MGYLYFPPMTQITAPIKTYNRFLRDKFGEPILKIPVNGGFTCPNIDGSKGVGGCIYCDNRSFSPVAHTKVDIEGQLRSGIERAPRRFGKFLAYFQPYSNTHGTVEKLRSVYEPALTVDNIVGLALGTRPDCFNDDVYQYLEELHERTYLSVEIGVQSAHDETLVRINRCQTHRDSVNVFNRLSKMGIESVAHVIMGLPGESREMMLETARILADLPVEGIKLHQLMVIKGTVLEGQYNRGEVSLFSLEEYTDLLEQCLEILRPDQVIHRLMADCTLENGLVAPMWSTDKMKSYGYIQKRLGLQ